MTFAPVSLERLVDSPVFAGRTIGASSSILTRRRRFDYTRSRTARRNSKPGRTRSTCTGALVAEALALFGSRHYRHYDFLFAISSQFAPIGLEHHESSENAVARILHRLGASAPVRDLLPHELVHSWNGKFRRPADLLTASYEVPLRTSLLWVYEGLTEYWGIVLAGRSGLWSSGTCAKRSRSTPRRSTRAAPAAWRNLQDTTQQPILFYRGTQSYPSWQRAKDYYSKVRCSGSTSTRESAS